MGLPDLPYEVWLLIAEYLVFIPPHDGRCYHDHQQWQVKPPDDFNQDENRLHPLKAFSQVCKLFSGLALPMLWNQVHLEAESDFIQLGHLFQLVIALKDDNTARFVQSITINARFDGDMELESLYAGQMVENWVNMECTTYFPTLADFEDLLIELGFLLPRTNLIHFCWRGPYRPPAKFYDGLAKCSNLTSFSFDLGKASLPTIYPGDYPEQDDALDRLSNVVTTAKLGFGLGANSRGQARSNIFADKDLVYFDLRDSKGGFKGTCSGLVHWLGGQNRLDTFYCAAPILYQQPWLLPLWAKLIPQDVQDEPYPGFGEKIEEHDMPYISAAKAFRPLLLENRCTSAEKVLALIQGKEVLGVWRKWHSRLEGETVTVLKQVIEALRKGT